MPPTSADSVVDAEQRKQIDLEAEKELVEPEVDLAPSPYLPKIDMIPLRHTKVKIVNPISAYLHSSSPPLLTSEIQMHEI